LREKSRKNFACMELMIPLLLGFMISGKQENTRLELTLDIQDCTVSPVEYLRSVREIVVLQLR